MTEQGTGVRPGDSVCAGAGLGPGDGGELERARWTALQSGKDEQGRLVGAGSLRVGGGHRRGPEPRPAAVSSLGARLRNLNAPRRPLGEEESSRRALVGSELALGEQAGLRGKAWRRLVPAQGDWRPREATWQTPFRCALSVRRGALRGAPPHRAHPRGPAVAETSCVRLRFPGD